MLGQFLKLNSQVSSWFCRTNDPLIWPCPGLNMVVSQKCFKGLPLKFCFRPFGDIRWNWKWNIKSAVNRKWQPEILFFIWHRRFEGKSLLLRGMTWASRISPVTCHFLAINTFGCREPAWNLRGQLFWNLTVKSVSIIKSPTSLVTKIWAEIQIALKAFQWEFLRGHSWWMNNGLCGILKRYRLL